MPLKKERKKTLHTSKCKVYSHGKLNTSKRVIRSRDLFLATQEEIRTALGKQEVIDYKMIIKKSDEEIQIHILTFN